ncbi:FecR family protein [Leeia aquatica]|uniref:FecR domain-containing protein n=1 Tax=Leeia aquatica TaxID=2725557 RepID=A0A847SHY3_9NEIS|nr:FecR family protein [Leeia aquatica]NLR76779.1 FecR domain-containing protein [Leeia aquatica]
MTRCLLAAVISLLCSLSVVSSPVGYVHASQGNVAVRHVGKTSSEAIEMDDPLENGDVVSTGQNSWVILSMQDGASLTLRAQTQLRIEAYRYHPQQPEEGRSWLSLLTGSLRSVTGAIGQRHPASYQLKTPQLTIGIRGTDYEVMAITDDSADAELEAGTYAGVHDGEIELQQDGDVLTVGPEQEAFASSTRPGLLMAHDGRLRERLARLDRHMDLGERLSQLHNRRGQGFGLDLDRQPRLEQMRQARREARQQQRQQRVKDARDFHPREGKGRRR